jgi:hypothetical protein
MSKVRIHASDGHVYEIDAPDGMSDEDIQKQFETQMGGANAAPAEATTVEGGRLPRKGEEGFQNFIDAGYGVDANGELIKPDQKPTSQTQGFVEGIEKPFNNAAQWAENGLNMLGGLGDTINKWGADYLGTAPSVEAGVEYQKRQRDASPYQSGGIGKFAGEVVGTALTSRLPGNAWSKGAQAGALLTDDPNNPLAVASDAAIGSVSGGVGDAAIRGVAKIAAPVVSPTLRTLIDAGTKVTPGQAARGLTTKGGNLIPKWIAEAEDAGTSKPFLRTRINEGRANSTQSFMAATIDRAVKPIGETLPDTFDLGSVGGRREAVKWGGDKLGAAFDDISPQISLTPDPKFTADLSAIDESAATMPDAQRGQYKRILENLNKFWTENGQNLSGDAFKEVDTRLATEISDYATSLDPDHRKLSRALESVRDAAYDALSRQNPELAATIKNINKGWKGLTQVERASANSKGMVNPNGYSQAVRMSSDTVRRRGYARGDALNQDLADAGSDILPSDLPDSGTGFRSSKWLDGLIGLGQAQVYKGAEAITPLLLRKSGTSPELARLLQYLAPSSRYALPAAVGGASNILPSQ